ncbi:MAG TPA: hypothetical protein VKX25_18490 [Bryobacteraceae bacterium]|nr:hypothetical protein [Bryobacteraceae bacterium]
MLLIFLYALQVAATPFVYTVVHQVAVSSYRPAPPFSRVLIPSDERLIRVLCLWLAPCLVYVVQRRAENRMEPASVQLRESAG